MSAIDQVLTGYGWQNGDLDHARTELASLRAAAAERDELKRTVQAQAAQLEQARVIMRQTVYGHPNKAAYGFQPCSCDYCKQKRTWLAANAPQKSDTAA